MNKEKIILILILVIGAFIRFYKLGEIPDGLQQDESSLGYNAYSILKTSRDEHGVFLPQNFRAFGEYKLPGYIYATVPSIAIFGLTPFAIRLPSALSAIVSIYFAYALTKLLLKINQKELASSWFNNHIALIVAAVVALNPWHNHFSRAAFEVMLANFFLLVGIYLLLSGLHFHKPNRVIAAVLFGSSAVYTYNIARLFVPLLYVFTGALYRKNLNNFTIYSKIAISLTSAVCLAPFIYGSLTDGGVSSTTGTLIFTSAKIQSQLQEIRSYFTVLPNFVEKILFNYWTLTFWYYVNNLLSHLSVGFYFINGSLHGNNSIGTHGQWYNFELPLVLAGIYSLWRIKNTKMGILFFGWIALILFISSLTREAPQATRTFFLIYPISLASGIGLWVGWKLAHNISNYFVKYALLGSLSLFCLGTIIFYFASYFIRFPIYYAKHWRTADRDIVNYIKTVENNYSKIVFDKNSGFIYTSLLTYAQFDPLLFHNAVRTPPDSEGFTTPISFGKYEFREIDWDKDLRDPKTLIITNQTDFPSNAEKLITIYYPRRPVVINVGQEIFRYPVEEIGYLAVKGSISER